MHNEWTRLYVQIFGTKYQLDYLIFFKIVVADIPIHHNNNQPMMSKTAAAPWNDYSFKRNVMCKMFI